MIDYTEKYPSITYQHGKSAVTITQEVDDEDGGTYLQLDVARRAVRFRVDNAEHEADVHRNYIANLMHVVNTLYGLATIISKSVDPQLKLNDSVLVLDEDGTPRQWSPVPDQGPIPRFIKSANVE